MSEWLALGLVPLMGTVFLYYSAWAEGRLQEEESPDQ
jgi:hypothetical protein